MNSDIAKGDNASGRIVKVDNRQLWTKEEFLAATRGRPLGPMPNGVSGISIDTRTLEPGDAFFAIKGDQFDGHSFATMAAGRGASLAVVAEDKLAALGALDLPLVVVGDVLEAMGLLGIAARARSKAKIIAVTGSAGKTTTKEMLATLLAPCGKVHASAASYNNHWGVPLSLSRLGQDAKFAIFEIGMNHPGEITPLVAMVRPHVAVITTIGAAHLGFFDSINAIAKAKGEVFSGVVKGGSALINRDIKQHSMLVKMAGKAGIEKLFSFGQKRGAKFALKEIQPAPTGSHIQARLDGKNVELQLGLPGKHMAYNLLAALGAASLAGADMDLVIGAVNQINAVKGRGKTVVFGKGRRAITLIDESYNANPASLVASLTVLAMHMPTGKGRRVAVLGDMLELGESSRKLHKELAGPIVKAKVDRLWLAGNEMAALAEQLEKGGAPSAAGKIDLAGHYQTAAQMQAGLLADMRPGDVIMIKASLGIKFGPLVAAIENHLAGA